MKEHGLPCLPRQTVSPKSEEQRTVSSRLKGFHMATNTGLSLEGRRPPRRPHADGLRATRSASAAGEGLRATPSAPPVGRRCRSLGGRRPPRAPFALAAPRPPAGIRSASAGIPRGEEVQEGRDIQREERRKREEGGGRKETCGWKIKDGG